MERIMIDIVVTEYGITNPCEVAEMIESLFGEEVDIMTIDHLIPDEIKSNEYYTHNY